MPKTIPTSAVDAAHIDDRRKILIFLRDNTKLGTTAKFMFLWLLELVGNNCWSDTPHPVLFSRLLGISRMSCWRAQDQLIRAGLVEFDDIDGSRIRCIPIKAISQESMITYDLMINAKTNEKIIPKPAPPPPKKIDDRKTKSKGSKKVINKKVVSKKVNTTSPLPETIPGDVENVEPLPQPTPNTQQLTIDTNAVLVEPGSKSSRGRLTQEQGDWIRLSLDNMASYLCYGASAAMSGNTANAIPTATNWRQFIKSEPDGTRNMNFDKWTTTSFMGFYWFRVCKYRFDRTIPLSLPVGFGRTGKTIKELMRGIGSPGLFQLIDDLTTHFDLVKYLFGGRYGQTLTLNEATLDRVEVRGVVEQIQQMSKEQKESIYEQIQEKKEGE